MTEEAVTEQMVSFIVNRCVECAAPTEMRKGDDFSTCVKCKKEFKTVNVEFLSENSERNNITTA